MKKEHVGPCGQETASRSADWAVTRRDFLKTSGCVIAGLSVGMPFAYADRIGCKTKLLFGIVADVHYADTAPSGVRHYRESMVKMAECVRLMNDKKVRFLVELGDLKDEGKPAPERSSLEYLEAIEEAFGQFTGNRYHVLGNRDLDGISKEQFLSRVENTGIARESKYYSFDSKGLHFIVLDANYQVDGSDYNRGDFNWTDTNIPSRELDWLEKDLASTSRQVIVFVHQQLDGTGRLD